MGRGDGPDMADYRRGGGCESIQSGIVDCAVVNTGTKVVEGANDDGLIEKWQAKDASSCGSWNCASQAQTVLALNCFDIIDNINPRGNVQNISVVDGKSLLPFWLGLYRTDRRA